MTKIELTHDAEQDLIHIFLKGIEPSGSVQAEKYAETLNAKIEMAVPKPVTFAVDGPKSTWKWQPTTMSAPSSRARFYS